MVSDFVREINKLQFNLKPTIEKVLDELAKTAQHSAKTSNLFKGNVLRDNIKIIKNGALARTVLADKDYAFYVEYGNNQKGDYIYPVRAKALHFVINGNEVFAKRVRAHGPLPFMQKALEETEKQSPLIIDKILGYLLK